MEDNRLPKQLMFGELASGKRKRGRPLKRFKNCQKSTPRSLSPALMTGLDCEPSPDMPRTHSRRGTTHGLRGLENKNGIGSCSRRSQSLPMFLDLQVYNRTPQPPPCLRQMEAMLKRVIIDFDGLLLVHYAGIKDIKYKHYRHRQ